MLFWPEFNLPHINLWVIPSLKCNEDTMYDKKQVDYVLLPRKLTAENGAKSLLMGEFFEKRDRECPECFDDVDRIYCDLCDGEGHIYDNTMISWTTIKAIYDKIVEHYGNLPTN